MSRHFPRLLGILFSLTVLLSLASTSTAFADSPDFTNVPDILGGRRRLFPVDDLAVMYATPSYGINNALVPTANGEMQDPIDYNVLGDAEAFAVGFGRMFNLPRDTVVSVSNGSITLIDRDPNNPQGYSFPLNASSHPNLNQFPAVDFTGDGYTDFAYILDGSLYIMTAVDVNDISQGVFISSAGVAPFDISHTWAVLSAGDYDGDGKVDLALAAEHGNVLTTTIYTVQTTYDNQTPTQITLTSAGSGSFDIPSSVENMAITSGVFSGATNPTTTLPIEELALLYQYEKDGHHVELQTLQPSVTSTSPLTFVVTTADQKELFHSDTKLSYVSLTSDRLNFYGDTEQIVTQVQEDGDNAHMVVFTLNSQLELHFAYDWKDENKAHIHTLVTIGNFDQATQANGPLTLEIAALSLDIAPFYPGCGSIGLIPTLYLYHVKPDEGYKFEEYTSKAIGPCFTLTGNFAAVPTVSLAAGDFQGRSLFLGQPTVVTAQHTQPEIVLGMPPMHVDWTTPVGSNTPTTFNVSGVPLGFYSSYQTTVTNQTQSSHKGTTSYTNALKETLSGSFTLGIPDVDDVTVKTSQSATQQWKNNTSHTYSKFDSMSFDASTQTGFDDQLWYNNERQNIYIYPVIGQVGCPVKTPNCADSEKVPLTVTFSGPDQINQTSIGGSLVEWFQPVREPGQVFSYPWNLAQLQALEPNLDLLTSSNPTEFYTDGSTLTEHANWQGQSTQEVTSGSAQNYSWDKSVSISGDVSLPEVAGGGDSLSIDYNGSKAISTLNSSTTTLGQSTGVGINKPGTFPNVGEYQYGILPFIYGTNPVTGTIQTLDIGTQVQTNGILRAEFAADPTDPNAGSWWRATYNLPDVALNHPNRWNVQAVTGGTTDANCLPIGPGTTTNSCATFNAPNTDLWLSEFHWMKGLFITPASANGDGPQIDMTTAGKSILLQARVYNYSLADMAQDSSVVVEFYAQPWDQTTLQPAGNATLIDTVGVGPLPGFNSISNGGAEPNWAMASTSKLDTNAYSDQYLAFWVVVYGKNADGTLVNEMPDHNLTSIPPTLTDLSDAAPYLEGHSNNVGLYKSLFYIAPSNTQVLAQTPAQKRVRMDALKLSKKTANLGDEVVVTANVRGAAARNALQLTFYDGNPNHEGEAFEAERISHVRGGDMHQVRTVYHATRCGTHNLFVEIQPDGVRAQTTLNVTIDAKKAAKQIAKEIKALGLGKGRSNVLGELVREARKALKNKDTKSALDTLNTLQDRIKALPNDKIPAETKELLLSQLAQFFRCVK